MQAKRVAAVTAALAALGAVVGALGGAVLMIVFALVQGSGPVGQLLPLLARGAAAGGALGLVLGPLAAWLLMRHVPIGLAIGGTALGSIAGAVVGLFVSGSSGIVAFALGGFAVAAVALWLLTPRGTRPGAGARGPSA